jgi:hypothetical protein
MSNATYSWEELYMAAIYETDNANMPGRILEAVSAIEQRLLSPVEHGSGEDQAIKNAQHGLATLRAERCASKSNGDGNGNGNGNGHFSTMP